MPERDGETKRPTHSVESDDRTKNERTSHEVEPPGERADDDPEGEAAKTLRRQD